MRALHRLGLDDDLREAHVAPVEGRDPVRPAGLHRGHELAHLGSAPFPVHVEHVALFAEPPGADPEHDPPVRDPVEGRDRLGGEERPALQDEADGRPEPDAPGGPGRRREADVGVHHHPVLVGERASPRIGGVEAFRDHRMLGEEQRLEAEGLHALREPGEGHGGPGRERHDPEAGGRSHLQSSVMGRRRCLGRRFRRVHAAAAGLPRPPAKRRLRGAGRRPFVPPASPRPLLLAAPEPGGSRAGRSAITRAGRSPTVRPRAGGRPRSRAGRGRPPPGSPAGPGAPGPPPRPRGAGGCPGPAARRTL